MLSGVEEGSILAGIDQRSVQTSMLQCANGMDAFVAVPGTPGPHPAVLQLREGYGLVQHTRDIATRFASEGYAVIAPNLFFKEPKQEEIARGEANGKHNDALGMECADAAIRRLVREPSASPERLTVMGVCATRRYPLVISAERPEVAAAVTFSGKAGLAGGGVAEIETLVRRPHAPELGGYAKADHSVSLDNVLQLRQVLDQVRRSYFFKVYPHMPHGYLNDTMPGRYLRPEAEAAWELLMGFLARVREGGYPSDRVQCRFESDISPSYAFTRNVRFE